MRPSNELLAKYHGGQMAMINWVQKTHYRGEIDTISIEFDAALAVHFKWLAKLEGNPPHWVNSEATYYGASLWIYGEEVQVLSRQVLVFIPGDVAGTPMGDQITIYPPDCDKLDPKHVQGLELKT